MSGPERAVGCVFVPTDFGLDQCLADMCEEDYQRYRRDAPSVWNEFAAWWAAGCGGGAVEGVAAGEVTAGDGMVGG